MSTSPPPLPAERAPLLPADPLEGEYDEWCEYAEECEHMWCPEHESMGDPASPYGEKTWRYYRCIKCGDEISEDVVNSIYGVCNV